MDFGGIVGLFYFIFIYDRTIYNMCTQKPPHDYSQQLYDKYKQAFEEYISSTVRWLPFFSGFNFIMTCSYGLFFGCNSSWHVVIFLLVWNNLFLWYNLVLVGVFIACCYCALWKRVTWTWQIYLCFEDTNEFFIELMFPLTMK